MAEAQEEPTGEVSPRAAPRMKGIRAGLPGELAAEFLGTFVLIAFGDGVVATVVVGLGGSGREAFIPGGWVLITLMTAGLVSVLWMVAGEQLQTMFTDALNSVTGPGAG